MNRFVSNVLGTARFIQNHPLASRRKSEAFRRWLGWQIGSRLLPGPAVVPFIGGTVLVAEPGMTGATGNIYAGLHEFEDMAFTLHYLRKDDLFVDVGANIGSYTVLAAGVRGARCLACEPLPKTFAKLERNISFNSLGSLVTPLNVGVSSAPGTLRFTDNLDTVNHVVSDSDAGAGSFEVEVKPLDLLVGGNEVALLKIDVEGFETEVIHGAQKALAERRIGALIVELNGSGHRYGFDDSTVHDAIISAGYSSCEYRPFTRELIALNGRNQKSGNTIYVRDLSEARERLRSTPSFHVLGISV